LWREKADMIDGLSDTYQHTPAKLEEFEATFKHFDKDDTNVCILRLMELMKDPFDSGNAFCPG
jgi:hypothetical protein